MTIALQNLIKSASQPAATATPKSVDKGGPKPLASGDLAALIDRADTEAEAKAKEAAAREASKAAGVKGEFHVEIVGEGTPDAHLVVTAKLPINVHISESGKWATLAGIPKFAETTAEYLGRTVKLDLRAGINIKGK